MQEFFRKIYDLQDRVLDLVFEDLHPFYLTGGTALSRFYLRHRFSDDLDLFTSDVSLFSESVKLVVTKFLTTFPETSIQIDSRDFKRIVISADGLKLKVDFVADRVHRIGTSITFGSYRIDNLRNILSNKLGVILSRDEGRDVADILFIARQRRFHWQQALEDANTKQPVSLDELLCRLSTFPIALLDKVFFLNEVDTGALQQDIILLCSDLRKLSTNSLALEGSLDLG